MSLLQTFDLRGHASLPFCGDFIFGGGFCCRPQAFVESFVGVLLVFYVIYRWMAG